MDLVEQENFHRTLIGKSLVRSLDLLQDLPILYLEVLNLVLKVVIDAELPSDGFVSMRVGKCRCLHL